METWRLLDSPPMSAADNMALDDVLVELKGVGATPNTIHFLQFRPKAVLVGFHQSVQEEIRTDYCRAHGIDVNRRTTGGGAILFDESQLGWEVICDKSFFGLTLPTGRLFRALCEPVVTALAILGLKSAFRPRNDIEINGRKISGTGGTESQGAFLFQGTMLVDFDLETMLKSLKIPIEKLKAKEIDSIRERVTCLNWELGYTPSLDAIKQAVQKGFERHLGIRLEAGGLTATEERLFAERMDYYRSSDWIDQVKPEYEKRDVVQAAYKTDAGLVRFTLVVNLPRKRLKEVYITGDFLSFPTRALFDLEAELRGSPLDGEHFRRVIGDFFARGRITIPGMAAEDFCRPLDQALQKIAISNCGIPLEYCNLISVTNGSFEEIMRKKPSVLLLPYCSKLPECDLRYQKGCRACGECSVGSAWALGREKHMKNVCVTNFEDLMGELEKLKRAGTEAYIGCCCQAFFIKHMDDFARAGVPGILLDIDNTTCYELDQARQAYAGSFTSQTEVNLDLLRAVMEANFEPV
jgi:lipoate---protein ligase